MRDENDSATLQLALPCRPGRPPANGLCAMTDAERSKLYRERQAKRLSTAPPGAQSQGSRLSPYAQPI
ncbi:hypothetical protein PD885_02029 [Xanthomonas fragariae]|uniref:Uncharacterized protein n=1 Tax=Xanthomonas fragariae TaxID=48664 RepID=A0ABY1RPQ8_9XANT|nr:hypothetical protein NBC2815_01981 [Xanthomonas fragariae]SMQ99260.1 hypothetical protein PD885_02016 [Xanthomonas fragariae]SMQ99273.1 hypothetical protein PD885_02029 [Xanthomonas fragariae]